MKKYYININKLVAPVRIDYCVIEALHTSMVFHIGIECEAYFIDRQGTIISNRETIGEGHRSARFDFDRDILSMNECWLIIKPLSARENEVSQIIHFDIDIKPGKIIRTAQDVFRKYY